MLLSSNTLLGLERGGGGLWILPGRGFSLWFFFPAIIVDACTLVRELPDVGIFHALSVVFSFQMWALSGSLLVLGTLDFTTVLVTPFFVLTFPGMHITLTFCAC